MSEKAPIELRNLADTNSVKEVMDKAAEGLETDKSIEHKNKERNRYLLAEEEALVEAFSFMVAKPLELVNELCKGEHYHAVAVALKRLDESVLDFRVKLERFVKLDETLALEDDKG